MDHFQRTGVTVTMQRKTGSKCGGTRCLVLGLFSLRSQVDYPMEMSSQQSDLPFWRQIVEISGMQLEFKAMKHSRVGGDRGGMWGDEEEAVEGTRQ